MSGSLNFVDVDLTDTHIVKVGAPAATWSAARPCRPRPCPPLQSALTTALADSTGSGAGHVDFTFSLADKAADFLAAGETLKVTYAVTVTDPKGVSSVQSVTVTVTGTNDAPAIAADATPNHALTEVAGVTAGAATDAVTGSLSFTDVDLNDTTR